MGEIAGRPEGSSEAGPLVLVVDDVGSNRLLAVRMLERLGYASRTASDGVQALGELEAGGIDLVLMDCQMPEPDGFETTRELRRREAGSGSHTPVVAMTAGVTGLDREACAAAGMDDYLSKPVMLAALGSVLERWLSRAPAAAAPPSGTARPSGGEPKGGGHDLERLRLDVGDEAAARFVATFLAELPAREAAIASAVTDGSAEGLRRAAHALKSPSAALGASALSALCARLESEAGDGRIPGPDVLEELSSLSSEVAASVRGTLDPGDPLGPDRRDDPSPG